MATASLVLLAAPKLAFSVTLLERLLHRLALRRMLAVMFLRIVELGAFNPVVRRRDSF